MSLWSSVEAAGEVAKERARGLGTDKPGDEVAASGSNEVSRFKGMIPLAVYAGESLQLR